MYWFWLSTVRNAISLLWSVGKMKFEAWPVDPPGLGSGPLSSSTMSVQPELGEVPGQAVADDAGADDHALGLVPERRSWPLLVPRERAVAVTTGCLIYHECITNAQISLLSARAYDEIRRKIIRLELAPGDVVREEALQDAARDRPHADPGGVAASRPRSVRHGDPAARDVRVVDRRLRAVAAVRDAGGDGAVRGAAWRACAAPAPTGTRWSA